MIVTPKSAPVERPSVKVNTTGKSAVSAKLDAIKARFSGNPVEAPKNKQGEAIPAQPSGVSPAKAGEQGLAQQALDKATAAKPSTSEAKPSSEATAQTPSPQLQMLAKQQQELRKAQQSFKAEQEAWKQEQAKYVNKESLSSDPLKALAEAGITQDRLVELQLNQSAPPSETELLKQEIAELRKQVAGVDDKFVSRDKQAYDNAVLAIERDVKLLVSTDPAYETIKALGDEGHREVVELIKKQFALDGSVLDVEDAAKQIEELALDREYSRIQKLSQLSKIKQKLAPPVPAVDGSQLEETKQSSVSQQTPSPTITNSMGINRPLNAREKAIRAFEEAAKKRS